MRQQLEIQNDHDSEGNPAGGVVVGKGLQIRWQDFPIQAVFPCDDSADDVNGAFVEGVIQAAAGRLEFYQNGRFACEENAHALHKLKEALQWLDSRAARRQRSGRP